MPKMLELDTTKNHEYDQTMVFMVRLYKLDASIVGYEVLAKSSLEAYAKAKDKLLKDKDFNQENYLCESITLINSLKEHLAELDKYGYD